MIIINEVWKKLRKVATTTFRVISVYGHNHISCRKAVSWNSLATNHRPPEIYLNVGLS